LNDVKATLYSACPLFAVIYKSVAAHPADSDSSGGSGTSLTFFCPNERCLAAFALQVDTASSRELPRTNHVDRKDPAMPMRRFVLSLAIAIGGATAAQNTAFSEEYRGTWEQQMACTPDVMRLCSDQIPDVNRIVACLRQNTDLLRSSCRAVFETNASTPQQSAPRSQQRTVQPNAPQPRPYNDEWKSRPYNDEWKW